MSIKQPSCNGLASAIAVTTLSPAMSFAVTHLGVNIDCRDFLGDIAQSYVAQSGQGVITDLDDTGYKRIPTAVLIETLLEQPLTRPISVLIECDEDQYLARTPDVPLIYGSGEDRHEALLSLIDNLESLVEDLNEDDDFSEEWLLFRDRLATLFVA